MASSGNPAGQRVQITVTGDCGHIVWEGFDSVAEKYPFWCEQCQDERREGRYPWSLTTRIVSGEAVPADAPMRGPDAVT